MAEVTSIEKRRREIQKKGRRPGRIFHFDYSLMITVIILLSFGVIMVYSSSAYTASQTGDAEGYLVRQLINIGVGFALFFIGFCLNYHKVKKVARWMYGLGIITLALLPVVGTGSHGAVRWISLGFMNLQPAELMKTAVIICAAVLIVKVGKNIVSWKVRLSILGVIGAIPAIAVLVLSDNLSSAGIVFMVPFFMLMVAAPDKKKYWMALAAAGIVIAAVVIYCAGQDPATVNWRLGRIVGWLHPEEYVTGQTYQTVQGLYAIGSGGFFGKGLGKSLQKLSSIPESQNDMIFAVICEELGIFGAIILIGLFVFLLWRIYSVAMSAPDKLGMFLCLGVFFHIAIQFILNIAVVTNLFPNTGVTLPFISYGGSALMFLMLEIGIVLNVSKNIKLTED